MTLSGQRKQQANHLRSYLNTIEVICSNLERLRTEGEKTEQKVHQLETWRISGTD